jgi:hypothetical protein
MGQGDSAAELRISKRTLQNLETVAGYFVSDRVIYRAARLYRCSVEWLKGETDEPGEPPKEEPAKPTREPAGDPTGPGSRPGRDPKGPPRTELAGAA